MLLDGADLRQVFAWQNPFRAREAGKTAGPAPRITVLAANANFPLEISLKAFCRAAAHGTGSPLMVQFSHNALRAVSAGQSAASAATGAFHAALVLEHYVHQSGARHVATALDHFKVPPYPAEGPPGGSRSVRLARASVADAVEASREVLGEVPDRELGSYVSYLSSPTYAGFKRELASVLTSLEPAWGMIDTERLPPVLDFALTRDMVDFVRQDLGFDEMMIEAEYGATGVAGESLDYLPLTGDHLARLADEVACFVAYTGADGISYPIGMEHSAPLARRHEPDVGRLEAVQRRVAHVAGRYVPFAQHGGTGAARLALGLVGKNNVNTHFLVAGANSLADRVMAQMERIRAGVKEACASELYEAAVEAIVGATVEKLREAGTYGLAPDLDGFMV